MTARIIDESPWAVVKQNAPFVSALIFILPFVLYVILRLGLI